MIRIVLTCLVTTSMLFVGCDEPAKPAADSGAAASPSTPAPPPKKGTKAGNLAKTPPTKPVD
jgi:hypothetical protein